MKLPEVLGTARLLLKPPRLEDAAIINAAVLESFVELNAWMDWAERRPSLDDSEVFCREAARQRAEGSACPLLMWSADERTLLGATGFARIDWAVPSFEIGYWCRTPEVGRGYVTEATLALTRWAFESGGARRVEVRMDTLNSRSAAVPERLGFELEGVLKNHVRDHLGRLSTTRIYALTSLHGLRVQGFAAS